MPHFDADQWSVLVITVIFGAARWIVAAFAVRPLMSQLVKSAILSFGRSLAVCPDKQTFSELVGMSQRFIDHFVGAFLLDKASRLHEQKASAVLVIVQP